jgi:hypothetical protein
MLPVKIILTKLSKLSQQDRELARSIQLDRDGQTENSLNWFRIKVPSLTVDSVFSNPTATHFKSGYA